MSSIEILSRWNFIGAHRLGAGMGAAAVGIRPAVAQFVSRLLFWQERARQRCELADLDDWQLSDMGITRAQATDEAQKPFWRD